MILVHRGANFDRARIANRVRLANAEADRSVTVLRRAVVTVVHEASVEIRSDGREPEHYPAERVFTLLGADAPVGLLQACGVKVRTHFGDRVVNRA